MKVLLALKTEYKQMTGQDYKPGHPPAVLPSSSSSSSFSSSCASDHASLSCNGVATSGAIDVKALYSKVAEQGEVVRRLKAEKVPKVE